MCAVRPHIPNIVSKPTFLYFDGKNILPWAGLAGKDCLIYRRSDVPGACRLNVALRVCAWIISKEFNTQSKSYTVGELMFVLPFVLKEF